jgi:hypothetical protein
VLVPTHGRMSADREISNLLRKVQRFDLVLRLRETLVDALPSYSCVLLQTLKDEQFLRKILFDCCKQRPTPSGLRLQRIDVA